MNSKKGQLMNRRGLHKINTISNSCLFFLLLLLIARKTFSDPLTAISIKQPMIGSQHQIFQDVDTVVGGKASIPCDIRVSSHSADEITLILWYRGGDISGSPIYSVDARSIKNNNIALDSAKHFIDKQYNGRISFNLTAEPALLTIDPIIDSDDGQYWCRVDFKWKRTTISVVSLNVIVPPNQVIIKIKSDKNSEETILNNSVLLDEGSNATFVCESYGGKPLPIIHWFRNDEPIKNEFINNFLKDKNRVQSELYLHKINSSYLNSVLKCQTSNDNQTFISSSVVLHINLRPTSVMIVSINNNQTLLSGMRATAVCRSFGPVAVHSWFISSKQITEIDDVIISDVNVGKITQSMITFVPTPEQNGSQLICRAENILLRNSGIEDKKILEVKFAPKVTLTQSGSGINGSISYLIRGNDLLLHCNISANPSHNRIIWLHNSNQLHYNLKKGVVSVNATLLVKNVSKEWIGLYQCVAHNSEGSGFSNLLDIHVLYPPNCLSPTQTIPANIGRSVTLICEVDSSLSNVTFFWYSRNIHKTEAKIENKGLKSKLIIYPKNEVDFGQYSCWARNLAGNQLEPCFYNIYENKLKQQLICETNISLIMLRVECLQEEEEVSSKEDKKVLYNLKIYYDSALLKNITSVKPVFNINFDEFHSENKTIPYQVLISAAVDGIVVRDVNIMLNIPNLKSVDFANRSIAISHYNSVRDSSNKLEFVSSVWIAITIVMVCSVIIIITIIITYKVYLIWKSVKRKRTQIKKSDKIDYWTKQSESTDISIIASEHLVLNPDVIPSKSLSAVDVSNDIVCNRFIKDSLTYENKNDINTRLEHNQNCDKLLNKMNRVTVLSDFHANVIDWDSIQVAETIT